MVLATLLMVISKTVLRSANDAGCINNLRSISNGIELFGQDHDGLLPCANSSGSAEYRIVLPEYVYGANAPRTEKGTITPESGGSAFSCPAARRQFNANTMTTTYGFNGNIKNIKKINILFPSKTMIMMDGVNAWFGRTKEVNSAYWYFAVGPEGSRRPTKNDQKNDFVHGGKVNVLFVDGHIEALTPIAIPTDAENVFWKTDGKL
jgi:prepilin-type processing-associated H-X9-DG protein